MIRKTSICLFIILISLMSSTQIADKVIKNAKIYTADASDTYAEALAIKNGLLIYVGTNTGVTTHIGNTTEVLKIHFFL